jgi:hypothetical protein
MTDEGEDDPADEDEPVKSVFLFFCGGFGGVIVLVFGHHSGSGREWMGLRETLKRLITFISFDTLRTAFDKPILSLVEGLTTNGIITLPFVLSLSKG